MNAVALAAALVEFDSRNPTLVPGAPGERGVAHFLASVLREWGFAVELTDVADGRPNLVARSGGGRGPTLMLNGHFDVVSVDGMTHPPFTPTLTDGKLYGRGAADMKGGVAAMCVAARDAVAQGIDGDVIIACVIDEEYESLGMRALLGAGIRADAAIVTEPTQLAICPAHRGFVWAELEVRGRAAHGSRYDLGVDAITHAALVLAELDRMHRDELPAKQHPLLGRASSHASTIRGGIGNSTYPDECTVMIERRTIPGETTAGIVDELERACAKVRTQVPTLDAHIRVVTAQGPSDVAADAAIVTRLRHALEGERLPAPLAGMPAWTDAALLNDAGIPAICFGPGDIGMAHADEEYVPVHEIEQATRVLRRLIVDWCATSSSTNH